MLTKAKLIQIHSKNIQLNSTIVKYSCDGKAEFSAVITLIFSVTWSFRNNSSVVIWCSVFIINYYWCSLLLMVHIIISVVMWLDSGACDWYYDIMCLFCRSSYIFINLQMQHFN